METEASQIDVQGTRHRMARDRAQALHHVMIDLRTALSNARTALEAYGLSPHAKSQLTNFSDHIKQIYGVVRILELDGIGLLAEEIIAAAQVPAEKQDGFVAEEYEVLVRATLSLETYIEQTEHGEAAAPLVLLPLLNDLRAVQQAPMLSEMALFAPNLDNLPPMSVSGNHSAKTMARRLRPYYQSGLLRWYNDPGDDRGLLQLTTIIHRMERASRNSHAHQVWWIARGLIDAVLNHAIELSVAVRVLFGKLDRVLKSIRDQGEDVLDLNPPRDVVKNMLYYIAKSPAVSIRVQDIKKQYALDHLLPDTEQIRRALGDLGGPMQGLPETIAAALKEELARVKVLLDSYTYGERQDPAMLTDAADILKSTADTLTLLGVYDAQKALAAGGKLLRDSVAREETLSESQMLLFAEQLLRVEAVLNNLREHLLAQPEFALSGSEDDSVEGVSAMTLPNYRSTPGAEFKKIRNLALKQCIGNFKAIKQQILSYVGDPKLHHAPSGVPTLLYEIGGCLEIMELSDAARIAGRLAQHIELRVLEVEGVPNEEFLDVLAEAIMSFELYLDTLIDEHGDPVSALQMVRDTEAVINKTASFKPTVVPSPVTKDTTMEATQNLAVTSASAQEKVTNIENLMTTLEEPVEAIDDEVIGIFFEEADEQIAVIKDTLLALRDGKPVAGLLQLMQRICHTLRGSARIVQAAQVAEVAEHVERLCGALEEGKVALNDQTTAVLSTVPTVLGVTLDAYKQSIPMPDIAGEFQLQVNRLLHAQSRGTDAVAQPLLPKTDLNSGHAADLLSSFIVEANASLDNIRRYIDECMSAPAGCRVSDGLIHTVKSITTNAATLDFAELAHISSLLENYLGKIKDANISADVQAFRILTDFCSTVNVLLLGLRSPFPRPVDTQALQRALMDSASALKLSSVKQVQTESAEEGQSLLDIFLDEVQKLSEGIEYVIALLDDDRRRSEGVAELLRIIHTIKGGARVAGIKPVGDLAHALESLLETINDKQLLIGPQVKNAVTRSIDALLDMIEEVRRGETPRSDSRLLVSLSVLKNENSNESRSHPSPQTSASIDHSSGDSPVAENSAVVEYVFDNQTSLADTALNEDAKKKAEPLRVDAEDLDQLVNYAGEGNIQFTHMETQFRTFKALVTEFDRMLFKLREQVREVEKNSDQSGITRSSRGDNSDPLDLQHFTEQHQAIGDLASSIGELAGLHGSFIKLFHDTNSMLAQQTKVHRSLHEGLLSARMVPFGRQAQRLQRLVRKTADELGKKARLNLEGVEGKLDRVLLDRLMGPLEHILRNALAHGIESENVRRESGKPREGLVTVRLRKDGQNNILEVVDDGAGIDLLAVRAKALEKGLVRAEQVLSHEELIHLILEPGFSTAKVVTQLAGRGVGLDAANREILQMGGSLQVESRGGQGTTFTIVLPFTMAMHRVVLIRHGDQIFAIPSTNIEHIENNVGTELLERMNKASNPTYAYMGTAYHYWPMGALISEAVARPVVNRHPLVLVKHGDYHAALLVDEVLGEREIFIKPAGAHLQHIPYITGATVLGDGRVALILDVMRLFRVSPQRGESEVDSPVAAEFNDETLKVLVVDDSVTVRKVTERFLARHQMNVSTAKDGIEALQRLEEKHPDIVLLDIEMPRMDGFEFTKRIRHDQRWQGLPIIMISSRSSPKHISHAEELGVNLFLGKPYQETDLLDHIYRLTSHAGERGH